MKKGFALPLIVSLGLALLLLATPPVLAAITDSLASPIAPSPGKVPTLTESLSKEHRSPLLPNSSAPLLICNRPASDTPPTPNNRSEYEPVAPPSEPIPPACDQRTETYHPPNAFQATWHANPALSVAEVADRLDVDIYPDGEWRLAPDCYDWPASCWDIAGDRWSFSVTRDNSGEWAMITSSGDYEPNKSGMEQALVDATLATLNHVLSGDEGTGNPSAFAVFDPAFDGCYIRLLLRLREEDLPASGMWPEAGP